MGAKIELKFIDAEDNRDWIMTEAVSEANKILITCLEGGDEVFIVLDKSTAIKFAKTLRTEINKIQ